MNLFIETKEKISIVKMLFHRLEAENTELVKKNLERVFQKNPNVAFDLTDLKFIDSAGLGLFLFGQNRAREMGGKIAVFGLGNELKRFFEVVRVHKVVAICENADDAVSHFNN